MLLCVRPLHYERRTDNSIKNFYNATVRSKAVNKNESFLVRLSALLHIVYATHSMSQAVPWQSLRPCAYALAMSSRVRAAFIRAARGARGIVLTVCVCLCVLVVPL